MKEPYEIGYLTSPSKNNPAVMNLETGDFEGFWKLKTLTKI